MHSKFGELVGRLANAPQVYVYQRSREKNGYLDVFSSYGFKVGRLPADWHIKELDENPSGAVACRNFGANTQFAGHPLLRMGPAAASIFAVKLRAKIDDNPSYLVAINPEASFFDDDERLTALIMLARMVVSTRGEIDASPKSTSAAMVSKAQDKTSDLFTNLGIRLALPGNA